jgi:starch synthase
MKILFASAEVAPLTKVGGLADVVRSLPAELIKRGHEVRTIVPKYGFVDYSAYKTVPVINNLVVFSLGEYRKVSVESIMLEDVPVYLVSGDIFLRSSTVYGEDEVEKFFVFCDSVCEALPHLGWRPSVVHCHDWHTALLPLLLRNKYPDCRSVFTIHNVKYQGNCDEYTLHRSGLSRYWQACIAGGPAIPWNFMAQGILWSHAINAVSENFAREILTPEHGYGMQDLLLFRRDSLTGIINGLGNEEYDPAVDPLIPSNFNAQDIDGKRLNRAELRKAAGFEPGQDVPLVGMVSRMDEQKGLDIIIQSIPDILSSTEMQFVFLGNGKDYYEWALKGIEARFPRNVKVFITFDNKMAHLVYAGSDIFLMPSRWEPCGLGQMIAMKYGTVPVVRKTGGLADTVSNLSIELKKGNGFVFADYSAAALTGALKNAAAAFKKAGPWEQVIKRIMKQDFSWEEPAKKYEMQYKKALELT